MVTSMPLLLIRVSKWVRLRLMPVTSACAEGVIVREEAAPSFPALSTAFRLKT